VSAAAPQPVPEAASHPEPQPAAESAPDAGAVASRLISVVIPKGPAQPLTYRAAGELPPLGSRVRVPLGPRQVVGFVVEHPAQLPPNVTRPRTASEPLDSQPPLPPELLALARRVAGYYMVPWAQVLAAAVPPVGAKKGPVAPRSVRVATLSVPPELARQRAGELLDRAPRQSEVLLRLAGEREIALARLPAGTAPRLAALGLVKIGSREERRQPLPGETGQRLSPVTATPSQAAAVQAIIAALGGYLPMLLHGVTGSGKTEVYLSAAEHAVARGGQVLLLTPEIALAARLVGQARARFGERVALLHSALSDGERNDEWRRIRGGHADVVIGTRSAVFAPLPRLALIVVDEEHDGAYKQEESPRYHARDVALMRGREQGVPVLLGSATPSMETYARALEGHYRHLHLPGRVHDRPLPAVQLIDLREQQPVRPRGTITRPLLEALSDTLERGEQAMLLLNRRGFSPLLLCPGCGHTWQCSHCKVTLTFHRESRSLRCHYCDAREQVPASCGTCGERLLVTVGTGTEGLLDELTELLPKARIARMDRDTTRTKDAHLNILRDMEARRIDVLIGTQMIAKGHDLPGVTLVGVVCADQGIHAPDFRAAEAVFTLLTQVAGRAGRHERPGRVLLQTYSPDHPAVRHAMCHDYRSFASEELDLRRAVGFPPAGRVIRLVLRGRAAARLEAACARVEEWLNDRPGGVGDVRVLGPAPAPLPLLRDEHRAHMLVYGATVGPVRQTVHWLLERLAADDLCRTLRVDVDVDPQTLS